MSGRPPRPPAPEPPEGQRGSFLPIMLAMGGGFAVVVALLFLTLGLFAYVVVAGLLLFLVAAFHYLIWGRWLERVIRAQVEEEDRLEQQRQNEATATQRTGADGSPTSGGARRP